MSTVNERCYEIKLCGTAMICPVVLRRSPRGCSGNRESCPPRQGTFGLDARYVRASLNQNLHEVRAKRQRTTEKCCGGRRLSKRKPDPPGPQRRLQHPDKRTRHGRDEAGAEREQREPQHHLKEP